MTNRGGNLKRLIPVSIAIAAAAVLYGACGGSSEEPGKTDVFINPTPPASACVPYHTYLLFNYYNEDGQVRIENLGLSGKPDSEFPTELSESAPDTLKFALLTNEGYEVGSHWVSLYQMSEINPQSTAASLNNFSRQPLNPLAAYLRVIGPSGQMPITHNGTTYAEGLPLEDL